MCFLRCHWLLSAFKASADLNAKHGLSGLSGTHLFLDITCLPCTCFESYCELLGIANLHWNSVFLGQILRVICKFGSKEKDTHISSVHVQASLFHQTLLIKCTKITFLRILRWKQQIIKPKMWGTFEGEFCVTALVIHEANIDRNI